MAVKFKESSLLGIWGVRFRSPHRRKEAAVLPCYPHLFQMLQACLGQICMVAKHGDCTQEKWKLKLWNPDFIINLGIYIITTRSSRKRLNIANKRRRELGKPRRCNDLVSLGPSGINLWKKLTGSWKIGTPALFCFPFSHMESEMMDVVGNWGKLKGSNPRPSGEQKKHFSVAHLLKALHMKKHTDTNTLKLPFVGDTDHKFVDPALPTFPETPIWVLHLCPAFPDLV